MNKLIKKKELFKNINVQNNFIQHNKIRYRTLCLECIDYIRKIQLNNLQQNN